MDENATKYLFGPVPSRRLGRSLGIDIIPLKTCTQNCIYCQLGQNAPPVLERGDYVPIEAVLDELAAGIEQGLQADYLTISGSGEPTLHSRLGELIDRMRRMSQLPIAVITNGTLLSRADVRRDCAKADVVLPSLDAGDPETFAQMNLPHYDLDFNVFIDGLIRFRQEYAGQIWLEVFFCEGVNTDDASVAKMADIVDQIAPDRIQVNTSVRPVTDPRAKRVEPARLEQIARRLGPAAEVIAEYAKAAPSIDHPDARAVLDTLKRRPCTLDDLAKGLGLHPHAVQKAIAELLAASRVVCEQKGTTAYYKAI